MSLTALWAIGILSCDLAIYLTFKRMYGEKYRKHFQRPGAKSGSYRLASIAK